MPAGWLKFFYPKMSRATAVHVDLVPAVVTVSRLGPATTEITRLDASVATATRLGPAKAPVTREKNA